MGARDKKALKWALAAVPLVAFIAVGSVINAEADKPFFNVTLMLALILAVGMLLAAARIASRPELEAGNSQDDGRADAHRIWALRATPSREAVKGFAIREPERRDMGGLVIGSLCLVLAIAIWAGLTLILEENWYLGIIGMVVTGYFVASAIRGSYVRYAYLSVGDDELKIVHDAALRRPLVVPADSIFQVERGQGLAVDDEEQGWRTPSLGTGEPNLTIHFHSPRLIPTRSLMSAFRVRDPVYPDRAIARFEPVAGVGLVLEDPKAAAQLIRRATSAVVVGSETAF
ncbi:MAG: hypothetical protein U0R51_03905 [Solirubrobacterales bacterium]